MRESPTTSPELMRGGRPDPVRSSSRSMSPPCCSPSILRSDTSPSTPFPASGGGRPANDDSVVNGAPAPGVYNPQMIGRTLSRYRILDEVSRGGMGIVYRAMDTRLGRE